MTASDPKPKTSDQGMVAEAFPHQVLLGPPTTRTIPIFALQAEAGRPDNELWSISSKDDSNTIDKQAAGRLRSGRLGDHRFLTTRHKVGLRAARYAPWLAFCEEGNASEFLTVFPRYGLSNLLADVQRRIATIEHELQQGLAKGRYNLGELDEEIRYRKAKLYVSSMDELHRRTVQRSALEELREKVSLKIDSGSSNFDITK